MKDATNPEAVCAYIALTTPKYHEDLFETITTHDYFENTTYRAIIKAAIQIREKGKVPDLVSIAEATKIDPQTIVSISTLDNFYDWQNAALNVREKWMYRKYRELCAKGLEADYDDIFDLLTNHTESVDAIIHSIDNLKNEGIDDLAMEAVNQMSKMRTQGTLTGAPSGIGKLDNHTRGFQPTDLIILAARPGMGKTAFALTAATASQRHGEVLFFSQEMSAIQLVKRMYTQDDRITMNDVFSSGPSDDLWPIITEVADRISSFNIQIFDSVTYIEDIAAKVASVAKKKKVSLVIIDYLQLCGVREKVQGEEQRISRISWKAKTIAKRSNVPVLMLSQLSRQVENRPSKRPQLSDLRHSGSIEQDADMVLFPWRSEPYDMVDAGGEPYALIDIAKYRNGEPLEIGGVDMKGTHMKWVEVGQTGWIEGDEAKF